MKSKKTKTRDTVAKRIKTAAQSERIPYKAHEIAVWGRPLTPLEEKLKIYYACKAGLKTKEAKRWAGSLEYFKANLVADFISAVENYNSPKFHEFAEAVRFFKSVKRPDPESADWLGQALLELKILSGGQKVKIRKLAEYLENKKPVGKKASILDSSDDGFRALRRKCHEINFPLEPSR